MKKTSSKLREDIAKLQEQLKQSETREAERIGRIALKAGLGEIEIDEAELQEAFEDVARRFSGGKPASIGAKKAGASPQTATIAPSATAGDNSEA